MKFFRISGILLSIFITQLSYAQLNDFHFRNKIYGVQDAGWYSIYLPDSVFPYINREFTDIRIYHVKEKDTIENPYILEVLESENKDEVVELTMTNKSTRDGKLYCTFELKENQHVNYLDLNFEERNFNGYAQLEGSADQKEWFKIDTLKRILSLEHDDINFKSTTLTFPETTYPFLRLSVKADKPLILKSASFKRRETKPGLYSKINTTNKITTNHKAKENTIEVRLRSATLISKLCINADHEIDFYRPITIEVMRDSSKTQKGWPYFYQPLYSGTIASLNSDCFEFARIVSNRLKITIHNADNPPLTIKSVDVFGPMVQLVARLPAGDNYLLYGNPRVGAPSYDIVHFKDKIPATLPSLQLMPAENLLQPVAKKSPLLESKIWLWIAMGVVILVLGYFTLTMMSKKADG